VVVAAIGAAGLVRGAVPQSQAAYGPSQPSAPIVVTNAYVRPPVPPNKTAAAYFTVYNTTSSDDRLLDVISGAGATSVLHTTNAHGQMVVAPNGVVVPAHGSLVLSTGKGHVMIGGLFGTLKPGQSVDLELDFRDNGPINVVATVIAVGAPVPGSSPSPSGAHS
jgi:copper(I)-binding protein